MGNTFQLGQCGLIAQRIGIRVCVRVVGLVGIVVDRLIGKGLFAGGEGEGRSLGKSLLESSSGVGWARGAH